MAKSISFVTTFVLMKLLTPDDFGIVALCFVFIGILRMFSDLNLGQAIIVLDEDFSRLSASAFTIVFVLDILIFCLLAGGAYPIALYYDNDALVSVMIILSLTLVMESLSVVPKAIMQKELRFAYLALPELVASVTFSIVAVTLALRGFSYWSLVIANVSSTFVVMGCSFLLSRWRPRFAYDKIAARKLLDFAKDLLGAGVASAFFYNIDKAVIGKMMDVEQVGIYSIASRIGNFFIVSVGYNISRVLYPVFARMKSEGQSLASAYLFTFKYWVTVSFWSFLFLFITADPFQRVLYQSKWEAAVVPIKILAAYGSFRCVSATNGDLFKVLLRPNLVRNFWTAKAIMVGVLVIPICKYWGLIGVCTLFTTAFFLSWAYECVIICRLLVIPIFHLWRSIRWGTVSLLACLMLGELTGRSIENDTQVLAINLVISLVAFPTLFFVLEPNALSDAVGMFRMTRRRTPPLQ